MKLVVAILLGLAVVLPARAANYDVYLFAGQSNMDGRGKVADLSAEQRRPFAFIKGSKGGTSLSRDWKPGTGPCYRNLIETVSRASRALIRLTFTHPGGGLVIGAAPWIAPGTDPVPTDRLAAFAIAGADKKWFPADAIIDGNTVVVSSLQAPDPVAVRYGWDNCPPCDLYNKEGLPAATFRTDDWDEPVLVPPTT